MFVIETLLADDSRESLLANLDFHLCIEGSILCINQSHTDALVAGNGVIACGHLAHLLSVLEHSVAVTGNRLVAELDADDALGNALGLLLLQSLQLPT